MHSLSLWQVQSAACSSEAPSDGSKWSSQLIVWFWSIDGSSLMNRNVLTENPISLPNDVWTTFSLFCVPTHRMMLDFVSQIVTVKTQALNDQNRHRHQMSEWDRCHNHHYESDNFSNWNKYSIFLDYMKGDSQPLGSLWCAVSVYFTYVGVIPSKLWLALMLTLVVPPRVPAWTFMV